MKAMNRTKFLIVDDDEIAVLAMTRALSRLNIQNPIIVAKDGQEALDRLRGIGGQAVERPYVILLDLNMPRMSGLEFLAELREDEVLNRSIIFVLTTSDAPSDITAAYAHKIAGYIVKDNTSGSMRAAMELLESYTELVHLELAD